MCQPELDSSGEGHATYVDGPATFVATVHVVYRSAIPDGRVDLRESELGAT